METTLHPRVHIDFNLIYIAPNKRTPASLPGTFPFWSRCFGTDFVAPKRFGADILAPKRLAPGCLGTGRFDAVLCFLPQFNV